MTFKKKAGDYLTFQLDVKAILGKHAGKGLFAEALQLIRDQQPMNSWREELHTTIAMHKPKLLAYRDWYLSTTQKYEPWPGSLVLKSPPGLTPVSDADLAIHDILDWVNENLFKPRTFKAKQLYIWGPSNWGKTSLVILLSRWCRIYSMSTFENFLDGYEDGTYDLMVLDEFKAQYTVQDLNLLLQGSPFGVRLRVKGGQYLKKDNLPVMILSNFSLTEAYKNCTASYLESLMNRLIMVKLQQPIPIDNIFWESPVPGDGDGDDK